MKFVNSSDKIDDIDKKEIHEISFNKIGRPISDNSEKVFAKAITIKESNSEQNKYAILVYNNQPYDPYGTDSHREKDLRIELKSVSQQTHSYYISYLRTKNSLYMIKTQRSFING